VDAVGAGHAARACKQQSSTARAVARLESGHREPRTAAALETRAMSKGCRPTVDERRARRQTGASVRAHPLLAVGSMQKYAMSQQQCCSQRKTQNSHHASGEPATLLLLHSAKQPS
jgi:hypothetical protein